MRRTLLFTGMLATAVIFSVNQITSSPTGTPAPAAGGPAEGGATCYQSGCHVGAPTTVNNIISTNIPAEGYTPNTNYTITITVTGTGNKGFQLSPQRADGTPLGTFTPGSACWEPFSNYITHNAAKSASTATWNFTWTAPAAGSGAVSFYGAFAITRYTTRKQVLTVQEHLASGISEVEHDGNFTLFPNPAAEKLNLLFDRSANNIADINLIALDGRHVRNLFRDAVFSGSGKEISMNLQDVESGVYFVQVNTSEGVHYEKVFIGK